MTPNKLTSAIPKINPTPKDVSDSVLFNWIIYYWVVKLVLFYYC